MRQFWACVSVQGRYRHPKVTHKPRIDTLILPGGGGGGGRARARVPGGVRAGQPPVVGGAVVTVSVGVAVAVVGGTVVGAAVVGLMMCGGDGDGDGEADGDGVGDLEGDADGDADLDGFADGGGGAEESCEDDGCEPVAALDGVPVGIGTSGVAEAALLVATAAAAELVFDALATACSAVGEPRS